MKTGHLSVCLWLGLAPTLVIAQATRPADAPAPSAVDAQLDALRAEIDAMLLPTGLPDEDDIGVDQELIEVAKRSGELARSDIDTRQQLDASNIELRAYNALVNDALRSNRQSEASFRLAQLRSAAEETKDIPAGEAEITSAFWLLNADLIDINRNTPGLLDRQFQATARLEAFLDEVAEDEVAAESSIVTDVKLGVLRLYVQTGQSRRACALLEALGEVDDPRTEAAEAICRRIGEPWGRPDHRGQIVLLSLLDEQSPGIGQLPNGVARSRIVITPEALEDQQPLIDRFAVQSLPWYVVVDRDGRIAAIGQTEAILSQIEPLLTNDQ